jgi:hypothetical protein
MDRSLKPLVESLKPTPLVNVADSLASLQEARHRADYDHFAPFPKATVLAHIDEAEKAIRTLENATERQRQAFFALLAINVKVT